jgi:hypothetical protein
LTNDIKAYRCDGGKHPWCKPASVGLNADPEYPIDYHVPSFGADPDMANTARHLKSAEGSVGQEMQASFRKPKGHPVDYKVPDFGVDRDIIIAQGNIAQSEKNLKHVWTPPSAA